MKAGLLIALWLAAAPATPVDSARQGYAQAEAALQSAHATVTAEQARLDALSADIARAKSQQAGQPALFVPGELEKKLAQSQALADALDKSRAGERARAADDEKARAALYQALSTEIAAREAGVRDPAALAQLQQLQAERAKLAPSAGAQVQAPTFAKPSDDPKELRERADALRDQADKLSRQEGALQQRIQAARDQAQLDQQLRRLSGDDALFDESDRRIRVSRTDSTGAAADSRTTAAAPGSSTTLGTTPTAGVPAKQGGSDTNTGAVGSPTNMGAGMPSSSATVDQPSPSVSAAASEVGSPVTRSGELVRPDDFSRGASAGDDGEESLPSLLAAQQRLEQERARLEAQAKVLDAQAAGK